MKKKYTFIDLFCEIGVFSRPMAPAEGRLKKKRTNKK